MEWLHSLLESNIKLVFSSLYAPLLGLGLIVGETTQS